MNLKIKELFKLIPLLVIPCLIFNSCSRSEVTAEQTQKGTKESKLKIGYSLNLETLCLIFNLSKAGESLFKQNPLPRATLARSLTRKFDAFKNHEAVIKLNSLLDNDLVDLYDVDLALFHDELPSYLQYTDYPIPYYVNDIQSKKDLRETFNDFSISVGKFFVDSKLDSFIKIEARPIYEGIMKEISTLSIKEDYILEMEKYYGRERNSYNIIVSAFSFNGIGRSKTIPNEKGISVFQLITSNPQLESDSICEWDSFQFGYSNEDYFREMAMHELGHSFFHEALRENKININKVKEIEFLFTKELKRDMKRQGYMDWITCFEEHLVRLGEIKIMKALGLNSQTNKYRNRCVVERGFKYIPVMEKILEEYESNRESYAKIDDFIPTLVLRLSERYRQI